MIRVQAALLWENETHRSTILRCPPIKRTAVAIGTGSRAEALEGNAGATPPASAEASAGGNRRAF
jgi:hypothetical protein